MSTQDGDVGTKWVQQWIAPRWLSHDDNKERQIIMLTSDPPVQD
jgi:hypothetical protein